MLQVGTHDRRHDRPGGGGQVHAALPPGPQEGLAHCPERRGVLVPHEEGGGDPGGGPAGGDGLLAGGQQVH